MPTCSPSLAARATGNAVADPAQQPFTCADESAHYAFSVCMLLQQYRQHLPWADEGVVELGTGDASAIADVVRGLPDLRVHGYDISATSVDAARRNIAERGVSDRYTVELADFFDSADSALGSRRPRTAISNPPYIPAPSRDILMPELWGGEYGNDLTLQLLKSGHPDVIVALPSYADPVTTLATAADLGYRVVNFLAMGLDFGQYSSEPVVRRQIERICAEGRGWAGDDEYMVAVVLLSQDDGVPGERSAQLMRALQLRS
ncbi:MAG: hypothetical protein AVDCRST_MAG48-3877 [uncultured Friedmanniella sp.]|uniref:Methylase n=1 Tax=uncultured Friedmanniella sp. TaxID=335381 RepID=A0A6J4LZG8_9ACTN|nr:MAG: hypothetical protein AVDCRST_MAG48-3877 [uncultured Friedmanniella sp.]